MIALLVVTTLSLSMSGQEADDYKPFVESAKWFDYPETLKEWGVFHTQPGENPNFLDYSSWLSDNYNEERYNLLNDTIVRSGKTYLRMNLNSRIDRPQREKVWLREENRKVYVYSEVDETEHLLYDFMLKEGDTFTSYDIDSGKSVELKVLKEGLLTDGPWIYPYNKTLTYDKHEEQKRPLRTWVMGMENEVTVYPPIYDELFTLIEGIGCNEGPFYTYNKTDCCDFLAYVAGPDRRIETDSEDIYLCENVSFTITNTRYATIRGCDLPIGKKVSNSGGLNELTFELEDGKLHVYGNVCVGCGSTDYVSFVELPTEDSNVHILKMGLDATSLELATCQGMYQTDFWISGFGLEDLKYAPEGYDPDKIEYKVVITEPGYTYEFPVIKKNKEDDIFQIGRKWIVINSFYTPSKVYSLTGYKCEGQEVVDGLLCNVLSDYSMSDFENPFEVDDDVLFSEDNKRSTSYIFQNGSKYYLNIPDEGWVDELLYDFSLNKGDSILLYPLDPNTVVIGDLSSLVTEVGDTVLEESSDKRVRKWLRIDEFAEG